MGARFVVAGPAAGPPSCGCAAAPRRPARHRGAARGRPPIVGTLPSLRRRQRAGRPSRSSALPPAVWRRCLVSTTPTVDSCWARSWPSGPGCCRWRARWSGSRGTVVLARPGALGTIPAGGGPRSSWWARPRGPPVRCTRGGAPARPTSSSRAPTRALGGVALLAGGLARGEAADVHLGTVPASAWWALLYLVTVGSLARLHGLLLPAGEGAAAAGTRRTPYVNPVVAVLLGWLLLGEVASGAELAGGALRRGRRRDRHLDGPPPLTPPRSPWRRPASPPVLNAGSRPRRRPGGRWPRARRW